MTALGDYLKATTAHRWEPGVYDCCTLPGDWAVTWGRGDPLAEWRGTYRSDAQAIRLINRAGGLIELWKRGLASIGVGEVDDLRAGDVGVVVAANAEGRPEPVGAVFSGTKWAYRSASGLIFSPATMLAAWGPR